MPGEILQSSFKKKYVYPNNGSLELYYIKYPMSPFSTELLHEEEACRKWNYGEYDIVIELSLLWFGIRHLLGQASGIELLLVYFLWKLVSEIMQEHLVLN